MRSVAAQDSFADHRDAVYGWAYRLLGNHHDALDVTQEVFVKWWRAHRENRAPHNAVGWLRRVTVNHSINLCNSRARRTVQTDTEVVDRTVPSSEAERSELAAAISAALSTLPERQRAVLFAKVYDGCTFADIAVEMELAVPTVKTHYLRALRSARRKLIESGLVSGGGS